LLRIRHNRKLIYAKDTVSHNLHLGCGYTILPGFINIDIRDIDGTDRTCSIYPLDYKDDTFDLIYGSHLLEHFPINQALDILKEWVRVLKKYGTLRISVPDIGALIKIYQQTNDLSQIIGPLFGRQDYQYNYHMNIFDYKTLKKLMEDAGLTAIHPWDYRRTVHSDYWDYSQAETKGILISLNLEGRKKGEKNNEFEKA
jgi:predicted SAM-dependent methyltransferase